MDLFTFSGVAAAPSVPMLFGMPRSAFVDFDAWPEVDPFDTCASLLGEVRREINRLHDVLAPADRESDVTRDRLMGTYALPLLDESARARRKPLFQRLDAIAVHWGPTRQQLRALRVREKELDRELKRARKDL